MKPGPPQHWVNRSYMVNELTLMLKIYRDISLLTAHLNCRVVGGKHEVPQTPSPRHRESRRRSRKTKWERTDVAADISRSSSNIEQLFWKNRKPYRRVARKRSHFESLSPFIFVQNS